MSIQNEKILSYHFLDDMYQDDYFPKALVKKGEDILRGLCEQIEQSKPTTLEQLYVMSHNATLQFNELQTEFEAQNSEIETVARESIGGDFYHIARVYGFADADIEALIAPREW